MASRRPADLAEAQVPRWHAWSPDRVLSAHDVTLETGLTPAEAVRRKRQYGPNALPGPSKTPLWAIVARQFASPLIYLLFLAAALALAFQQTSDAIVIGAVVLLNAAIGAFQEGRAERALEGLRALSAQRARVVRAGEEQEIDAAEVVPGDILIVEAGDAVAADARILESAGLQVLEAALTGESLPVLKQVVAVDEKAVLSDRASMLYASSQVAAGRARAVTVATGLATAIGEVARLTKGTKAPPTPLERRVAHFGKVLMVAAIAMSFVVTAIGLLQGVPLREIVLVSVSQMVGMVPEGLPAAMTVALAVAARRMAKRQSLVRRTGAVETLGSTTVICTDKTGTLTRNEMTVTAVHIPGRRLISVAGSGYASSGALTEDGRPVDAADETVRGLLEAAVLCNNATLNAGDSDREGPCGPNGDPTEVALLVVAKKAGLSPREVRRRFPRQAEIPFDATTKMMATQHEQGLFIKGAPEAVFDLCDTVDHRGESLPLDEKQRQALDEVVCELAESGLRILAVARADTTRFDPDEGVEGVRGRATLLGLFGQMDPPREEAVAAVKSCRAAGIRPVVVTGDHQGTALAIAGKVAIATDPDGVLAGAALEALSDADLDARLEQTSVFARVQPAQKLRIVEAYQRCGHVVAMTGDGVNDAPALVRADVGVAMGRSGTEVAKEAADIVLTDDNFASIVAAVEEGRIAYRNIKKSILYLVSTSIAEVLILLTALILGYPPPLAAVQILWINLVTEGAVTVNLIMEPGEGDEMRRAPIARNEPLLTSALLTRIAVMTPSMAASVLLWFIVRNTADISFTQVQTEAFTVLAVCQWFNVLNCRSETRSVFSRGLSLFRNPWLIGGLILGNVLQFSVVFWPPLNRVFHTVPFGMTEFLLIGVVASLVLWTEELRKLIVRVSARH